MAKFNMTAGNYTYAHVLVPGSRTRYRWAIVTNYDISGTFDKVVCAFADDHHPDTRSARVMLAALAGCELSEVD
jgi:hypothetical protein